MLRCFSTRAFGVLVFLLSIQSFAQTVPPALNYTWSGDLRYRMAEQKEDIDETRSLQNLRARLGINAEVNEDVRVLIRLATASSAISTNQTMGDSTDPGMARRSFGLDQAYIDWSAASTIHFWLGRMANPFWSPGKSQIVFDSDLSFEGAAIRESIKRGHTEIFANAGVFTISENYAAPSDQSDLILYSAQLGVALKNDKNSLTLHGAHYSYSSIQGQNVKQLDKGAGVDLYSYPYDRYRGNVVYPNDPLLPADQRIYYFKNGYSLFEGGLEWKTQLKKLTATFYADYMANDRARDDQATEYGVSLTQNKIQAGYAYAQKESDSVVGAFTDSDMNGGGTDTFGSKYIVSYLPTPKTVITLTHYSATRGVSTVSRDYKATHLDFIVSF